MASKFIEVKEITLEVGKEYWRESYPSNGVFLVDVSGNKAIFVVFEYKVSWIGSVDSFTFVDGEMIDSLLESAEQHLKKGEDFLNKIKSKDFVNGETPPNGYHPLSPPEKKEEKENIWRGAYRYPTEKEVVMPGNKLVLMPTAEEVNEFIEQHSDIICHNQNSKMAMLLMFYWIKSR